MPRLATYASPFTSTVLGPVMTPRPRTNVPPLPTNRSTATVSSHASVASSRILLATGPQSGVTAGHAGQAIDPARLRQRVRCADHHLGGHAAPVGAFAPDEGGLDPDDAEPSLGELPTDGLARWPKANHDYVCVMRCHVNCLLLVVHFLGNRRRAAEEIPVCWNLPAIDCVVVRLISSAPDMMLLGSNLRV